MAIWDKQQNRPKKSTPHRAKAQSNSNGKSPDQVSDHDERCEEKVINTVTETNKTAATKSNSCERSNKKHEKEIQKQPSVLVRMLSKISKITYPTKNKPLFMYENTERAAAHNTKILENHDWDMEKAINAVNNTILEPGSEFHPIVDLEDIFKHHESWEKFKVIATEGVKYKFEDDVEYVIT